jgi:hypothetical protein
MRKVCSLLLWLALAPHATNALAETSLCELGEINFDSCFVGEKLMSFCASKNLSYFQYRFGTPEKVEFVFPSKRKNPKGLFFSSMSPDGLENRISFRNGHYTYITFSIDSEHGASHGIYILKDGALTKTLECSSQFSDQNPTPYSLIKHEEFLWFNR